MRRTSSASISREAFNDYQVCVKSEHPEMSAAELVRFYANPMNPFTKCTLKLCNAYKSNGCANESLEWQFGCSKDPVADNVANESGKDWKLIVIIAVVSGAVFIGVMAFIAVLIWRSRARKGEETMHIEDDLKWLQRQSTGEITVEDDTSTYIGSIRHVQNISLD